MKFMEVAQTQQYWNTADILSKLLTLVIEERQEVSKRIKDLEELNKEVEGIETYA